MLAFLYNLIINPLVYIVEFIFAIALKLTKKNLLSIILTSIVINTIILPLYMRADKLQDEERKKQKDMEEMVNHIKKSFTGDERYMMLSTYYRQQNYKPIYAIKSSLSLLLQIPFFMAAYTFFHSATFLFGAKAGNLSFIKKGLYLIKDLGAADAMFKIGNFNVNVLPILMTLISIVSGLIYTKGFTKREKIQTLILPILFLILLYNSPSSLVIYWTCNNIYSLIKNIIVKSIAKINENNVISEDEKLLKIFDFKGKIKRLQLIYTEKIQNTVDKRISSINMILILITFAILLGLCIPLSVIVASPLEFCEFEPTPWYILRYTFVFWCGIMLWVFIFYALCSDKGKKNFAIVLLICLISGLAIFLRLGTRFGLISTMLIYDAKFKFSLKSKVASLLIIITVIIFVRLISKYKKIFNGVIIILLFTISTITIKDLIKTNIEVTTNYEKNESNKDEIVPLFNLSKTGKNVIVIFADRFCGGLVPYVFNTFPDIKKQFEGFTFYPNTISFGGHTIAGSPGLYGGYEYIPYEQNKRDTVLLSEKYKEACLIMPTIFYNNGYEVTTINAGKQYSFYDKTSKYPYQNEKFNWYNDNFMYDRTFENENNGNSIEKQLDNFVVFSLMKITPTFFQESIYSNGKYIGNDKASMSYDKTFLKEYSILLSLPLLTDIIDKNKNTFMLLYSKAPHQPNYLSYPDYEPKKNIRVVADEKIKYMNEKGEICNVNAKHMDSTIATFMKLGNYMDYLREMKVYDNTRIIIVSDHGSNTLSKVYNDIRINGKDDYCNFNINAYNPVLLIKNFGDKEFNISDEFMTNADTPTIAMKGLINNSINPFTGKKIDDSYKDANKILYLIPYYNWTFTDKNKNAEFLLKYPDILSPYRFTARYWKKGVDLRIFSGESRSTLTYILKGRNIFDPASWDVDWETLKKYSK